jgi:hypothetical protein
MRRRTPSNEKSEVRYGTLECRLQQSFAVAKAVIGDLTVCRNIAMLR